MRTAEEMIAYALEMDPRLLPYVPELLDGMEKLGSDADLIVQTLAALGLPDATRVLDLGCGKGATAIEIARTLGWPVFGLDLFAPFIAHAEQAAEKAGVADRCTFRHGDIRTLAEAYPSAVPADVAIYAALGDVLGPLDETIGLLRRYVRPGGYLLIADDYVREGGSTDFPRLENYRSREATIRQLEAHGDMLLRVVEEPDEAVAEAHVTENALIRSRAEALAVQHPGLRDVFLQFADDQAAETAFLEQNMVSVVWVLQRR